MRTHFKTPVFYDQMQRAINLPASPQKIISIVPSQTELLFYLGLDEKITGITNFCTHPADKVRDITKVGGTKKLNIPLIKNLNPDLIIANKEENDREQVEELMRHFSVWISDINDLPDALAMIEGIGQITRRKTKAKALCRAIMHRFDKLYAALSNTRTVYLIWRKPYMVAGTGTFINNMLQLCGLSNAFEAGRYPEVNADMLKNANPEVVLLSSEPYPFSHKHIAEFQAILPEAKVILVDGEMFSWYGSRLLQAPGYFSDVIKQLS